jgi:hypothetical protein
MISGQLEIHFGNIFNYLSAKGYSWTDEGPAYCTVSVKQIIDE